MADVLACAPDALLSHSSAAALWGFGRERPGATEVSILAGSSLRRPGIRLHRRAKLRPAEVQVRDGIPVTSPIQTMVDMAGRLGPITLERMIGDADIHGHVTPPALRRALADHRGKRGVARLRRLLDHRTFRLTRKQLEQLFLPLARRAGLPVPLTKQIVNGFEVDFWWPDLKLVVETDGLRYHRTPAQQAKDRLRDQVHTAAGLRNLRFTHEQVRYEPEHVLRILTATAGLISRP